MRVFTASREGIAALRPAHILIAIVAAAAAFRFIMLGSKSLWSDEVLVVWIARAGWREVPRLLTGDFHPPFYYLFMKGWIGVFGAGEAAVRFPSACFSTLSVLLTYLMMRRVGGEVVSLLSAALVAVSPFAIMAGQEARMHTLLGTLVLGSTLSLGEVIERGGAWRWLLYSALSALMIYTQYLGFLVLAAHGLWLFGFERRHLAAWLGSLGVASLMYAPWTLAAWHHLSGAFGWPNNWAYRNPLDLLGLYALGGSVLGMGSYFFPGTLPAGAEAMVLLPFAILLGAGVSALSANRRALFFIALPPAAAIAIVLAVSLVKPLFYPRWFSFLVPFYAMFVGAGIVEVAQHARRIRAAVFAALVAGVLLANVPVLLRYYLDPRARPFQWREAAALVARDERPGDFLLFSNQPAEISFRYYFPNRLASLTLTPQEWRESHGAPPFTAAAAARLAAQHPRVWFIVTVPFTPAMRARLLPTLSAAFVAVEAADFNQTEVVLLVRRSLSSP